MLNPYRIVEIKISREKNDIKSFSKKLAKHDFASIGRKQFFENTFFFIKKVFFVGIEHTPLTEKKSYRLKHFVEKKLELIKILKKVFCFGLKNPFPVHISTSYRD